MNTLKLLEIDEDLTSKEVAELKFLCTDSDLLQKKRLERVSDAKDLFLRLEEQGLLEDGLLIPELLITIGRFDLLFILNTSREEVERHLQTRDTSKGVSPYRKMLYKLSEDMTDENLSVVRFLLSEEIPKSKLATSSSLLDILIEMEKQQMLGEDNLDKLQGILEKCDKQLANVIQDFKMHKRQGNRPPLQEVSNHQLSRPHYPEPIEKDLPACKLYSPLLFQSIAYQMNILVFTEISSQKSSRNYVHLSFLLLARRDSSINLFTDAQPPEQFEDKEYYSISHQPVGYCLIVNNYNFGKAEKFKNRKGTEMDREALIRVFQKMKFEVKVHNDLNASDMLNVAEEFANMDHTQMDVFVCCVLSHGEKGAVLGVDGKQIEIRELTLPFARCNSLASKPKLFFIQACQGNLGHEPVWMTDGPDSTEEGRYEEDARMELPFSLPKEADFLIGMATVEHYQSFRHTTDGSIYIQELCRQLENHCPKKEDILSIMTKVNHEVSSKMLQGKKQMPEPRYTLRKKLVLPMD
ncbi:caspase-8 isoform X1 [Triplophysa dalaica]|uniref:caspase-8 isoform X1 n=1 Tax=Triplophysa dalaica TaxID=1582913 RepID=UPI0024DFC076|nr:caspase-8 isoform X1 [Triplophysa dalaica]XP_056606103.1 caspase-8 isoform X1 [Triplophysa dalaica]